MRWLKVKVAQSCLTLCDPMDYTVLGILQAIILEWAAIRNTNVYNAMNSTILVIK